MHGPGCGHEAVPHDSHIDYLVSVQRASQHSPVWQLVAAVLMCRPEGLQHMMLQHHITPTKSLSIVCPQVGDELHHVVAGLCCPTGCLGDVSGAVVSHGRVSVLRRRRVRISPAAIARMEHKLDRAAGHVAMAEPLRCALAPARTLDMFSVAHVPGGSTAGCCTPGWRVAWRSGGPAAAGAHVGRRLGAEFPLPWQAAGRHRDGRRGRCTKHERHGRPVTRAHLLISSCSAYLVVNSILQVPMQT